MSLTIKAFLYQFASFAFFFLIARFLIFRYTTNIEGIWISIIAFIIATILSPKFKNIKTKEGDKIYVKWFFSKNVREL